MKKIKPALTAEEMKHLLEEQASRLKEFIAQQTVITEVRRIIEQLDPPTRSEAALRLFALFDEPEAWWAEHADRPILQWINYLQTERWDGSAAPSEQAVAA